MSVWVRVGLAVTIFGVWQSAPIAQQPVFKSATELVSISVSVTDQSAQPVSGLTVDQFHVFEDGVPQQVKFFAPGEMPLDVVILLDTSASMTGSMALVQQAASRFAKSLRTTDRAAVMGISNGLRILQAFSSDFAAVDAAINSTKPAGRTALYASIYIALRELEKLRAQSPDEPRRQAMVVFSDGHDTTRSFTFDDLQSVVRRAAVPIYTVSPRAEATTKALREQLFGESTAQADFELKKLAFETGGRSFFPVNLFELNGVYDDIAAELAHQYSLGYQSTNPDKNGSFRRIAVRIDQAGLHWRTRAGYLSDREPAAVAGGDDRQ